MAGYGREHGPFEDGAAFVLEQRLEGTPRETLVLSMIKGDGRWTYGAGAPGSLTLCGECHRDAVHDGVFVVR